MRWNAEMALITLPQLIGCASPGKAVTNRCGYDESEASSRRRCSTASLLASFTPISTGRSPNNGVSIWRSSVTSDGLAQVSVAL